MGNVLHDCTKCSFHEEHTEAKCERCGKGYIPLIQSIQHMSNWNDDGSHGFRCIDCIILDCQDFHKYITKG